MAWGGNDYGQADVPPTLAAAVGIAGGGYHSLALLDPGVGPLLLYPALTGGNFAVHAWTFLRKTYSLEFNESVDQSNWTPLLTFPGLGAMRKYTDTNANRPRGFYRMRVQ